MKRKFLLCCLLFSGFYLVKSSPYAVTWTPGYAFTVESTKCSVTGGEITIGGESGIPKINISLKGRTKDYAHKCTAYAHDEGGTCSGNDCGSPDCHPYTLFSLAKVPPPPPVQ